MKRILSFFAVFVIIVGIMLSDLSFAVVAEDINDTTESSAEKNDFDIRENKSVSFSCYFDPDNYSINHSGTVNHDALIKYRNYIIEIYAIPMGANAENIVFDPNVTAIAETPIAVRFQFSKKIESIVEKYYSYCVALRSQDGERILATDPRYAEVGSSFEFDKNFRSGYKGIESELISSASNAGAGRIVIPIFLNKLISEASSGYVYQTHAENIYFEKSYIEDLDARIRTATSSGAQTYLRILVDGVGGGISIRYAEQSENVRYYMPDVYEEKTLTRVEAAVSFLIERYEDIQSGIVNGMIVGSRIDDINFNYIETENDTVYTDKYALYTLLVANSARQIRSDIDIVIPFSDINIFDGNTSDSAIERLLQKFDHSLSSGLNFSAMIEGSISPLELVDKKLSVIDNNEKLYAKAIKSFDDYLNRLAGSFKSAPRSFSFAWLVPSELKANELSAAYTYSYFKLAECENLSSFIISFNDREEHGEYSSFNTVKNIFEHIDTSERDSVISNMLAMFEEGTWQEILDGKEPESPVIRKNLTVPVLNSVPSGSKGQFTYFDFSTSVSLNNWYKGFSCGYLRLDHGSQGAALRADMTASNIGEYSEFLCLYDYPENFKYTPYLAFRCKIENDVANNSLFEIIISGGQGAERLTASKTVSSGEEAVIVMDISEYTNGLTDSWKISVRSLDGKAEEFSLSIYDIVGYSMEYDSKTLASNIEAERLRIRNQSQISEDGSGASAVGIIIMIAVLVISLGIGIFVCIRPSDNENERENEEENSKKK
jgi:hypothetical protein